MPAARPIPRRHWRSYGDYPLPTGVEALVEPFRAFPSWFMRITCDRCGTEAAAIRAAHEQHGELSATVELRRRFPASRTPSSRELRRMTKAKLRG